jgi:hypothetical protein
MNRAGRLTLVTSVLSSMPTYHLTVFPLAVWARKKIDKIRRSFLWKGEENANGGHTLVNWPTVCRPKDLGGLGVSDLERFGRALRLRWLWQEWVRILNLGGIGSAMQRYRSAPFQLLHHGHDWQRQQSTFLAPQLARWRGTQVLGATPVHACAQEEQDSLARATQW